MLCGIRLKDEAASARSVSPSLLHLTGNPHGGSLPRLKPSTHYSVRSIELGQYFPWVSSERHLACPENNIANPDRGSNPGHSPRRELLTASPLVGGSCLMAGLGRSSKILLTMNRQPVHQT